MMYNYFSGAFVTFLFVTRFCDHAM